MIVTLDPSLDTRSRIARVELIDAVRLGVTAVRAAVSTPPTRLCRREDVESILESMA